MDEENTKIPPESISTVVDNKALENHPKNSNVKSPMLENLPLPPARVLSIEEDNFDNISNTYVDMTKTKGNSLKVTSQRSSYVEMKQITNNEDLLLPSDILNPLYSFTNIDNFNSKTDENLTEYYVDMNFKKSTVTETRKIELNDDIPPPIPIKTKIGKNLRLNINEMKIDECQTDSSVTSERKSTISEVNNHYEICDSEYTSEPAKEYESISTASSAVLPTTRLNPNLHREDISRFKTALIDPQSTQNLLLSMSQEENIKKKNNPLKKVFGLQKVNKENSFICEMFSNPLRDSDVLILKPIKYAGMLVLIPNSKDKDETRVVITDGIITWNSQKTEKNIKIEHIISIEGIDTRSGENAIFEIIWWEKQGGTRVQKFAARNIDERGLWMQNIHDAITCLFLNEHTNRFTRAGWLHIKEGTGGTWSACRLLLKDRELYYCVNPGRIHVSDLRMAKSITECRMTGLDGNNSEQETVILLELGSRAFYLRALNEQDLKCWSTCIKSAILNNGPKLDQQQLTRDFVPVIVDKCIKFVATHGSCSEGIYRRIESGTATQELLSEFRDHAWGVQLSRQNYSEHVVAATLRMFFSELPEPLIPINLAQVFRKIAMEEYDIDTKVAQYRALVIKLPEVNHLTSRRLFRHLHLLHRQSVKNKMNASSLANIWNANIIRTNIEASLNSHQQVIIDLITMFPRIFDVPEEDLQRELQIQSTTLEMFQDGVPKSPTSNLLLVWISIGRYFSSQEAKVYIGENTTAGDVVRQLGMSEDYMLQEYILGGALARPLIKSKKVHEIILRWSDWNIEDRKDNKLVLAPSLFYNDIMQLKSSRQYIDGELKFGDTSKKDFKKYYFEINRGILTCYKDFKKNDKIKEWKIDDIVWYLGYEPNRNPNTKWAITFIEKDRIPKRSKERVYFGYTLGGTSQDTLIQWSYALLHTVYIRQISDAICGSPK